MIVRLAPHEGQIVYHAALALNGFDTLGCEEAIANAKAELRRLLDYLAALSRAEYAFPLRGIETIEADGIKEIVLRDS